jgi:hypothetical protein
MTKSVLLFGVAALAALLPIWLLVHVIPFAVGPTGNHSVDNHLAALRLLSGLSQWSGGRWSDSPFSGLGPAIRFWVALLGIAMIRDYLVSRRQRATVAPFAAALNTAVPRDGSAVPQHSEGSVLRTTASGTMSDGREVNVVLKDIAGSRTGATFHVDVSCNCPWVFEIRRKNLFSRMLGAASEVVQTGDAELDANLVVQGDDAAALRNWLQQPEVRYGLRTLFEDRNVTAVGNVHPSHPGPFLRCELVTRPLGSPFADRDYDAAGILQPLKVLAAAAESSPGQLC